MDLRGQRRSSNVDDRRGGGGVRRAAGGLGIGGVLVVVAVSALLDVDPRVLLRVAEEGQRQSARSTGGRTAPINDEASDFVKAVLGSTEDAWGEVFQQQGARYPEPKLVLFRDAVQSACGYQTEATGPFYCPGDKQVYLDLSFFDLLSKRFGSPGDFAQAYVIAHEVGHHVQNVLGYEKKARAAQRGKSKAEQNAISVRLELQADCLAGVWANRGQKQRKFLQAGDVEEALKAAAAIGDDTLQKNAGRRVSPESFTHGSSAQRMKWFNAGMAGGTLETCDTFGAADL